MEEVHIYTFNLGSTVTWVAFTVGIIIYVIGYFGGIRMNVAKALSAMIIATVIGALARPLVNKIHMFIANNLSEQVAGTLVPIGWMIFVVGVGVCLYETFTVTAKEAHPYY